MISTNSTTNTIDTYYLNNNKPIDYSIANSQVLVVY